MLHLELPEPRFPQPGPGGLVWERGRLEGWVAVVGWQLQRSGLTIFLLRFSSSGRISLLNRLEQGDKIKMQPVPVIPCREETTARVDVLRRQPNAGRWER